MLPELLIFVGISQITGSKNCRQGEPKLCLVGIVKLRLLAHPLVDAGAIKRHRWCSQNVYVAPWISVPKTWDLT